MLINEQYKKDGYVMFLDEQDNSIVIGKDDNFEVVEVPVEFLGNVETREAIFNAYINLGDTYPVTIYRVIRETASSKVVQWASYLVGDDFWE